MEADFLRSLNHTRRLEAEVHDALAGVLKVGGQAGIAVHMVRLAGWLAVRQLHGVVAWTLRGWAGTDTTHFHACDWLQGTEGPHTAAAFAKLQQRTQGLQQRAAGAAARLEQQRQQLAEVSAAAKDALRKCDAMPAFKPGAAAGDGSAQQLLQKQPLEPALGYLRYAAGCSSCVHCGAFPVDMLSALWCSSRANELLPNPGHIRLVAAESACAFCTCAGTTSGGSCSSCA